ncbi:MAG: hypothetical protein HYS07_10875 [Chlamydiae bacterium]|nr:hypothetical protein [Chlamydiota bacterium]MBI3277967.1 hypothetical protein [Chlamydiota bacterium]
MKIFLVIFYFCSLSNSCFPVSKEKVNEISKEDQAYLRELLRETWDSISDLVDDKSGIPFDNSTRQNYTSMSNIGLYLASACAAQRLGYIDEIKALEYISKCITFIEQLEKWHGFPISWVQVYHPFTTDKIVSPIDSGYLAAGLLIARQTFPSLASRISDLINSMDWSFFYDPSTQTLTGGFDLRENKTLRFSYGDLGTDARMAFFLAVARGAAPPEFWDALKRGVEERYSIQYLGPGWKAGGLFLEAMTGLFLDEKATLMGKSVANLAYAQMIHAVKKKYAVWGWSACAGPQGSYLGSGKLIDDVVAPYASVLAIHYYPEQVIHNLKTFEKFNLRKPYQSNEGSKNFGFRDAVDLSSGKVVQRYLVIDQEMIFLSLCNFLEKGLIWNLFEKDPRVQKGLSLIKDYHEILNGQLKDVYQKRDFSGGEGAIILLDLGLLNPVVKPFVEPEWIQEEVRHVRTRVVVDGKLRDWKDVEALTFPLQRTLEFGAVESAEDLDPKAYFQWDENFLYFAMTVVDDEVINDEVNDHIFKGDCIELFIDAENDGLNWGNPKDFQIGFSPVFKGHFPKAWIWFQNRAARPDEVSYTVTSLGEGQKGYQVEAAISWKFLGIRPHRGLVLGVSPAVHDIDHKKREATKLNWCYLPPKNKLGSLTLEGKR